MSGILKRFTSIMEANIQDALDRMEDPEKQTKKILKDLENSLAEVKDQTAAVMAQEKKAKRDLDAIKAEIAEMDAYAEKAVIAGNDGDAETFLKKKMELKEKEVTLTEIYNSAASNSTQMREMHNKLVEDIDACRTRQSIIAGKAAVARTKETINKTGATIDKATGGLGDFARMEAKADAMLDKAMSREELDASMVDPVESIKNKYNVKETSVSDELAALKARLGK